MIAGAPVPTEPDPPVMDLARVLAAAIRTTAPHMQLEGYFLDAGDPRDVAEQLIDDLDTCADTIAAHLAAYLANPMMDGDVPPGIEDYDALSLWYARETYRHAVRADEAMATVAAQVEPLLSGGIGGLLAGLRG